MASMGRSGGSEQVLAALDYLEVDENASVGYKRVEVIKYGGDPRQCRKGRFWRMVYADRNLDWQKLGDALRAKLGRRSLNIMTKAKEQQIDVGVWNVNSARVQQAVQFYLDELGYGCYNRRGHQ